MTPDSLKGVFAVPPVARKLDATRAIDFEQNSRIVHSIAKGGSHALSMAVMLSFTI